MSNIKNMLRGTALATALSLPLAALPALAQDTQSGQTQQQSQEQQQLPPQGNQQPSAETAGQQSPAGATGQQPAGPDANALVATVGESEIRGSDVLTVIGLMPAPLRAQQPDLLVPLAIDQLVLRELILQEALEQNLSSDPEVVALVEQSSANVEEDALVQVWLQREFADRVSDQAVQQSYSELQANTAQELPPLEQIRPVIEQSLRQQALGQISSELRENREVTFYGPSGEPIEEPAQTGATGNTGAGQDSMQGQDQDNQPQQNQ